MSDVKVNVYTSAGAHVGYFLNPHVQAFPEGDYELSGEFSMRTVTVSRSSISIRRPYLMWRI